MGFGSLILGYFENKATQIPESACNLTNPSVIFLFKFYFNYSILGEEFFNLLFG